MVNIKKLRYFFSNENFRYAIKAINCARQCSFIKSEFKSTYFLCGRNTFSRPEMIRNAFRFGFLFRRSVPIRELAFLRSSHSAKKCPVVPGVPCRFKFCVPCSVPARRFRPKVFRSGRGVPIRVFVFSKAFCANFSRLALLISGNFYTRFLRDKSIVFSSFTTWLR